MTTGRVTVSEVLVLYRRKTTRPGADYGYPTDGQRDRHGQRPCQDEYKTDLLQGALDGLL